MKLEGKVAIVTGGGRGIGRAIARGYAAEGAKVAVAARTQEQVEAVAEEIRRRGGEAIAVPTDVTQEEQVEALVQRTVETWGPVNILVNDAGVNPRGPFLETAPEEWRQAFEVNVMGIVLCCRAVLPLMMENGGGHIINIGSGMGLVGHANQSAYCASKAAVQALTQALAEEMWPYNILVNVLIPGPVKTELSRPVWEPSGGGQDARFPSERWKEPEEGVPAAIFLATQPPTGMTGQTLNLMRRSP